MLPRKIYARCGRVQVAVARLPFISTSSRSASCVDHPASSYSRPCPISRAFRAPPLTSLHCYRSCSYSTSSPTSTSFPDPTRPDLFYHLIQPPNPLSSSVPAFALSFLATPPPFTDSSTIIGWLPASAPGKDTEAEAGLNDFRENRQCICVSSDVVLLLTFIACACPQRNSATSFMKLSKLV